MAVPDFGYLSFLVFYVLNLWATNNLSQPPYLSAWSYYLFHLILKTVLQLFSVVWIKQFEVT